VASRWSDLLEQISAGISFSLSGLPNWTTDIGGFAVERRYENPDARDLAEWRELNARWFQFGTFTPLFRSHGQFPLREIYNLAPAGSEIHDSMVAHARLRYRLLPYIYTLAGMTWHDDYTLMRGLFMDFPQDAMARDVGDEFMLGPALLVAPVHEYQARSREVYLPAGVDWHDFHSGALHAGGRRITVAAPVSRIPLFVRAGSILPVGPERQHVGDKPGAPVALHVYTGADGSFMLYEDSGLDYGYERGEFVRIALSWDESDGTLTIGPRIGSFPGMSVTRTFEVHWITPGSGGGAGRLDAAAPSSVQYSGTPVTLRMPRPTG
jgi:alpha-D-xyloside xylohydrolase